jgi:hypothetical protein
VGFDRIQLRATYDLTDANSSDTITALQAIKLLEATEHTPGCLTPSSQEKLEAAVSSRLSSEDWSSTPTEALISIAENVDGNLADRLQAVLRARVEHPIDVTLFEDGVPAIRVLGYLQEPASDSDDMRIVLLYEALSPVKRDYIVYMHGYPRAGTILPKERQPHGFMNWDALPEVSSSQWQPGTLYASSHVLPSNIDAYTIRIGLWAPDEQYQLSMNGSAMEIELR